MTDLPVEATQFKEACNKMKKPTKQEEALWRTQQILSACSSIASNLIQLDKKAHIEMVNILVKDLRQSVAIRNVVEPTEKAEEASEEEAVKEAA